VERCARRRRVESLRGPVEADAGWPRLCALRRWLRETTGRRRTPRPARPAYDPFVTPSSRENDEPSPAVKTGSELIGAMTGGALGSIAGPPGILAGAAGGVVASRVFSRVGTEFERRVFGPRQRVRVGLAYEVAAERIKLCIDSGGTPRQDGFFDLSATDRSVAEELLEGVLIQAADSYEERKVSLLGNLYAGLAFDPTIDRPTANHLIQRVQRLTFRQLALMAALEDGDMQRLESIYPSGMEFDDQLGAEVDELERLGLLGRGERGASSKRSGATFVDAGSLDPRTLSLTGPGLLLSRLLKLDEIPAYERREVFAGVRARSRNEDAV
jgi:hypothetical protein